MFNQISGITDDSYLIRINISQNKEGVKQTYVKPCTQFNSVWKEVIKYPKINKMYIRNVVLIQINVKINQAIIPFVPSVTVC